MRRSLEPGTPFAACPVCGSEMRKVTNTHLRTHGLTAATLREKFPDAVLEPSESSRDRVARGRVTLANRPESVAKLRANGKRLAAFRAGLSSRESAKIQARSRATSMARTTAEERTEKARRAALAAHEAHPELRHKRWRASAPYWQSPEGREVARKRTTKLWKDPAHREAVAEKNRAHAISGRIPVVFSHVKPSKWEKLMIAFAAKHKLPLTYVGDGRCRVTIPKGGARAWRNPDFVVPETSKVMLFDAFTAKGERAAEEMDYRRAGRQVLRVDLRELKVPETLLAKLRAFIDS